MKSVSIFLVCLFSWGCSDAADDKSTHPLKVENGEKSTIRFIAQTDMKEWFGTEIELRWGIAVSIEDITKLVPAKKEDVTELIKEEWIFNEPTLAVSDYEVFILKGNMESFKNYSVSLLPGKYDWLILLDKDNDGIWDGYLGSIDVQIKLNQLEFEPNTTYSVVVRRNSAPQLTITTSDCK